MNKLSTFAPDANPLNTGIALSVTNVYPSETGGMRATPTAVAVTNALDSTCLGCFAFQDLSNNFRTIAGTATKLYELSNMTWADVTPVGGYTATKWRFAGWGDYILAVNASQIVQIQTAASGDFADLAGSPIAKYITASNNFVICANIYNYENRVYWCAQGDHTDWVPSLSTQAGYYDLSDTPGPITGIARMQDSIVVFKDRSMYLGTYTGPPYVWNFKQIQTQSGTYSQESVIEHKLGVYYAGADDFYYYDGTTPKGFGTGVRWWFMNNMDRGYQPNIIGVHDGKKRLMFWFYPTAADGTGKPVEALIFDYKGERWGRIVLPIEAALIHWTQGITYDTLSTYFATYTLLEANAPYYDSPYWSAKSFGVGIIGSDHKMSFLTSTPGTSQIITGDSGSLKGYSRVLKAWPYFNVAPTTCSISSLAHTTLGATASLVGSAQSLKSDGSVDLNCSAKFIRLQMDMTGDWEIVGFDAEVNTVSVN